jgi:2-polyprenyl-6-hydroxyphenyl methylase/3-demethylubiquinone-9 3-methyltransferase
MTTTTYDNVDPGELAKFNSLASRWWDIEGEFRSLHEINPLRLDWIRQHAELAGRKVVDIGCGGGILAESMAAAAATVTGSVRTGHLRRCDLPGNA